MKMTQEEKAKAYDEALERAKKQRADYQKEFDKTDKNSQLAGLLRAGISAIDMAFPELAESESENERIRKWLVEYFSSIGEKSWLHGSSITLKEVLAWLEKQKEPKSISAEEVLVRAGLKPYKDGNKWCILAGDNIQEGICGFGGTIEDALYEFLKEILDLQKEQKPALKQTLDAYKISDERATAKMEGRIEGRQDVINNPEEYGLQKPAEWSEEDEKMFQESLTDIIYAKNELNKKGCEGLAKSALNAFNWLNTRFKYLCSQPKKNDIITPNKKFFQWIYDRLINVHNEDPNVDYMISFKNRIEELPIDKPHWKPSEEQMNRLVSVVAALRKDYCDDMADFLAEIYQGLKKLM